MMDERTLMILARLRQLWIVIQATNPDKPLPTSEIPFNVTVALRTVERKRALAEFQPLFPELMGGERVASVNTGHIDWSSQ